MDSVVFSEIIAKETRFERAASVCDDPVEICVSLCTFPLYKASKCRSSQQLSHSLPLDCCIGPACPSTEKCIVPEERPKHELPVYFANFL